MDVTDQCQLKTYLNFEYKGFTRGELGCSQAVRLNDTLRAGLFE